MLLITLLVLFVFAENFFNQKSFLQMYANFGEN